MNHAKLGLLAGTSLLMGVGFAQAADFGGTDKWVGFYAGGNFGFSWGRTSTTTTVGPFTQTTPFAFAFPGGALSTSTNPDGVIGGGQIGYNWRIAPRWLAGLEADFQGSTQSGSAFGLFSVTNGGGGGTARAICTTSSSCTNTTDITAQLSWFGTVRGRVGTEWNGLLLYGTGGFAYGNVEVSGNNALNVTSGLTTVSYSTPLSYSKTKSGWTAGGGIEGLIGGASNWSWKVEYLHIDLGSIGTASFGGVPVVTLNTGKFTDEIVRIGVNYHFGT